MPDDSPFADPQPRIPPGRISHAPQSGPYPPSAIPTSASSHFILMMGCLAIIVAAACLSVPNSEQVAVPGLGVLPELCTLRRYFGLSCPGCGMTRCFVSLAHGQLADAFRYNAIGFLMFAMIAFQVPYRGIQIYRIKRGRAPLQLLGLEKWCIVVLSLGLLVQWLVKIGVVVAQRWW